MSPIRIGVEKIPVVWLNPKNALHILRLLQETFTNIIKHTHASEIRLSARAEGNDVVIAVTDIGGGFDLEKDLTDVSKSDASFNEKLGGAGNRCHAKFSVLRKLPATMPSGYSGRP